MTDRIEQATAALQATADSIHLEIRFHDMASWSHLDAWADKRYGFLPPRDEVTTMATDVCPEMIVFHAGLADLDTIEFNAYLNVVNTVICYLQTNHDIHPVDERMRVVESTLFHVDRKMHALFIRVQMAALEAVSP